MTRIYKYPLAMHSGPQEVSIPGIPKIVHVHEQCIAGISYVVMWAEVYPASPERVRRFQIFATGSDIPGGFAYVGTAHMDGFVWHVYTSART